MKNKLLRLLCLTLLLTCSPSVLSAATVTVDGIKYEISGDSASVVDGKGASGFVSIKGVVGYMGHSYPIRAIREKAFKDCRKLTWIILHNSITTIGDGAFWGCTGLSDITLPESLTSIGESAFFDCRSLTGITLPESLTSIEAYTFSGCSGLTKITLPNSITSIGKSAFYNCTSLMEIMLPESITYIEDDTFSGCSGLSEITLPESLTSIGERAFVGCRSLTEVTLPESLTSIGFMAFDLCSGLRSLIIPENVNTIGKMAFDRCHLDDLVIKGTGLGKYTGSATGNYAFLSTVDAGTDVYAPLSVIPEDNDRLIPLEAPYAIKNLDRYQFGLKLKFERNKYYEGPERTVVLSLDGTVLHPDENGECFVTGLSPATSYRVKVEWGQGYGTSYKKSFKTNGIYIDVKHDATQTTMRLTIRAELDETATVSVSQYGVNVYEYETSAHIGKYYCTGSEVTVTGLKPGTKYRLSPFMVDSEGHTYTSYGVITGTYPISPASASVVSTTATSVVVNVSYYSGDANVTEIYFTESGNAGQKYHGVAYGENLVVPGLIPGRNYELVCTLKTDMGYVMEIPGSKLKFTTPALTLNMLQPVCVSSTAAIVAAETNISDAETNVGFQWKKYDSPASLLPKEGYAAVYDGRMEGRIDNLQSSSYYNVRAFYKDNLGTYYYSDWVTFDPSDFSYFEPTVHTYPAQNVGSSNAELRGYALAGTDEIVRQGFQYRPVGGSAKSHSLASDDYVTVEASGQVMTLVVEDLKPGTTYEYRTFAETASGSVYGEKQTFTTAQSTGVYSVETDSPEPEITGYYDLTGRRYDAPQRGFNIVLYSDGTTRKIVVK